MQPTINMAVPNSTRIQAAGKLCKYSIRFTQIRTSLKLAGGSKLWAGQLILRLLFAEDFRTGIRSFY